jgi:hypothetical protein
MKSRTTLLLVLLALAVGGFVVWDHFQIKSTAQSRIDKRRLLDIKASEIQAIEIIHTNQTILAEKIGDQWRLKKPIAARADDMALAMYLDELELAERGRTITAENLKGVNLADFGLTNPTIRVTLTGKTGKTGFVIGTSTPTKDAFYLQLDGSKDVNVIGRGTLNVLDAGVDSLRSRAVLNFTPATTTRLEIKSADRVTELSRSIVAGVADPRWSITKPIQARADQSKISGLLASLETLRIGQFVSDDPKDVHTYHLDEPVREITISMGDASQTLLIGGAATNDADQVYAMLKNGSTTFTLPAGVALKFSVSLNDLRDRQALAVAKDAVRGIELRQGDDKITLVNDAQGWQLTTPIAAPAGTAAATALLDRLTGLAVQQFSADVAPDLDKYGLASPAATVTLQGDGTNVLAQLLIGKSDDSNTVRYVKLAAEPFIYGVTNGILNWLPTRALELRSLRLAEMQAGQIHKLTIQKDGKQTVIERDAQNNWKLVLPPLGPEALNGEVLEQVVGVLAGLTAQQFVREGRDNLAEYGLDAPAFVATLQVSDKTYSLSLGKPVGDDLQYAFWSDPALVFTIPKATATTLMKSFVTRPANVPASIATPAGTK